MVDSVRKVQLLPKQAARSDAVAVNDYAVADGNVVLNDQAVAMDYGTFLDVDVVADGDEVGRRRGW